MEKRKLADDRPVCRNFVFLPIYIWGFRIGYLKKGNLLCSQILSIGLLNIITYIQISLLDKKFHDPRTLLAMMLVQLLAAIVWTYLFQRLYRLLFPPRRMLLVCGDRPAFHLMEKINSREDKYYLAKAIHIRAGMEAIIREAGAFDALIIGDIPAKDRNELLKKCFEEDIRTYTVPKLSDILIRTSEELDIFDSPLLLSRNEGISGGQRFVKRAIDLFFSGLGIVVLSPFFLLVALSIYLTDRGPVFYKQTRLTEGRKEFQICKFRTMIQNAEAKTGARLAAENDDRILPGRTLPPQNPSGRASAMLFNIWKRRDVDRGTAPGTSGAGGGDRGRDPGILLPPENESGTDWLCTGLREIQYDFL